LANLYRAQGKYEKAEGLQARASCAGGAKDGGEQEVGLTGRFVLLPKDVVTAAAKVRIVRPLSLFSNGVLTEGLPAAKVKGSASACARIARRQLLVFPQ